MRDYNPLLIELGLLERQESSAQEDYSTSRQSHASKLNIIRFVQQLPAWSVSVAEPKVVKKKIIFNDYRLKLFLILPEEFVKLYTFLLSQNFECYLMDERNKLLPFDSVKKLCDILNQSQIDFTEVLYQKFDAKEYIILDDILTQQLFNALASDLVIDREFIEKNQATLEIQSIELLTPPIISFLCELSKKRLWQTITCWYANVNFIQADKIIYKQVFSPNELVVFLNDLISAKVDIILEDKYGPLVEELKIKSDFNDEGCNLNLTNLINLEVLCIHSAFSDDIIGLEKCTKLKSIKLTGDAIYGDKSYESKAIIFDERYDFSEGSIGKVNKDSRLAFVLKKLHYQLPYLTHLSLQGFREVDVDEVLRYFPTLHSLHMNKCLFEQHIINLSGTHSLIELTLTHHSLKSATIHLIGLNSIQKLTIDGKVDAVFEDFPALRHLTINFSRVMDMDPLHKEFLSDLVKKDFRNLEALEINIEVLKASLYNQFTLNLSKLLGLRKFKIIQRYVGGRQDAVLSPIQVIFGNLSSLEEIEINTCESIDITPVINLKRAILDNPYAERNPSYFALNSIIGLENFTKLNLIIPNNMTFPKHLNPMFSHYYRRKAERVGYDQDQFPQIDFSAWGASPSDKIYEARIKIDSELRLTERNSASPVKTSGDSQTFVKFNTAAPHPTLDVSTYLRFRSNRDLYENSYRTVIKDVIKIVDNKVYFTSLPTDSPIPYILPTDKVNEKYLCDGRMYSPSPGKKITLISLTEKDKLVNLEQKDKFLIYQCQKTMQYIIEVNPNASSYPTFIEYTLDVHPDFFNSDKKQQGFTNLKSCVSFPTALSEAINNYLKFNDDVFTALMRRLQYAFDQKDYDSFITLLKAYCKGFSQKELIVGDNQLTGFLSLIATQSGVCSHRSWAFVTLCQYFGIYARYISNDCHAFVSIIDTSNQIDEEIIFDLGGGSADLKITNLFILPNEKDKLNTKYIPSSEKEEASLCSFNQEPVWLQSCVTPEELLYHLLMLKKSPLLRVNNIEQGLLLQHTLIKSLRKYYDLPFISIYNKYEMDLFFTTVLIENGNKEKIPGPLQDMILSGRGVIFINWQSIREFNKKDLAKFKCLMDDPGNFNGLQFTPDLHVIGIMPLDRYPNDVFLSRCQEIIVPSHLIPAKTPSFENPSAISCKIAKVVESKEMPLEVNLYNSKDWEKWLVGHLLLEEEQYHFVFGSFIRAIREKRPLVIYNAPLHDKAFIQFWHRFTSENRIFANGKFYYPEEDFSVSFDEKPLATKAHNKLVFDKYQNITSYTHVNRDNFSFLFSRLYIDDNDKLHILPGWLDALESHQFIISQELTDEQWQLLYDATVSKVHAVHLYVESHIPIPFSIDTLESTKLLCSLLPENHPLEKWANEILLPMKEEAMSRSEAMDWLARPIQIQKLNKWIKEDLSITSAFISTPDLSFMAKKICYELSLPRENIFYVTAKNAVAYLIDNVCPYEKENRIHAHREESDFLRKLRAGETVILYGDLTAIEYQSLSTLFRFPSYIEVNGSRIDIPGKIIWIARKTINSIDVPCYSFTPTLEDYAQFAELEEKSAKAEERESSKLKYARHREIQLEAVSQSQDMHEFLNSISGSDTLPITYSKYKALRTVLMRGGKYREVKSLFLYHDYKGSETYSLVKDAINKKLHLFKRVKASDSITEDKQKSKKNIRLTKALEDKNKAIIYLVGNSGTGKTYTAKAVAKQQNARLYVGEEKIKDWIEYSKKSVKNSSDRLNILLLDEFNLSPTGKYEILRGLADNPPWINDEGKIHYLRQQDKVIATGNTLQYPLRYFHSVLWEEAHTIWFSPFKAGFIEYKVRKYLQCLERSEEELKNAANLISQAYAELSAYADQHPNISISLRDIRNICARVRLAESPSIPLNIAVKQAIVDEVADLLLPEDRQKLFSTIGFIEGLLPFTETIPDSSTLILTEEKAGIWRLLCQDLRLRAERIRAGSNKFGKLGLLLEGESGIGKSKILLAALEQAGLSLNAHNPQDRIMHLSAGAEGIEEKLLQAFHGGIVVLLDELNVDPRLEFLLNNLLSGIDPYTQQPALNPGFMLFASQNPSYYDGCDETSTAILNRLHKIIMPDYKEQELFYIANKAKLEKPAEFVEGYLLARRREPAKVNTRTFFHKLKEEQEVISAGSKMKV